MSKANDPVSKLFNIRDARIMVFGGTIIDVDDDAGWSEPMQRSSKTLEWTAKSALSIYPKIQSVQEEEKDKNLGMSAVWNNGFVPVKKGLLEANNMAKRTSTFLNQSGFVTTDQIFKTRQPEKLNALFASMKWYSTDPKKKMHLIDPSLMQAEGKKNVIEMGMICEKWTKDPVSIRYVFRDEPTDGGDPDRADYIYLIGGSRELLANDMRPICKEISQLYTAAQAAFDADSKKKQDGEALKLSNIQSKAGVWLAYDKAASESALNDAQIKTITAMRNRRRLVRLIQGIVYIRNYLVYAQQLGMDTVLDFEATASPICKAVKTADVQAKYEEAYQYCKNLINVFPDIANCAW
jgi:hypothetical protein